MHVNARVQVAELHLEDHVRFVVSFTDNQRAALLAASTAVVYTPQVGRQLLQNSCGCMMPAPSISAADALSASVCAPEVLPTSVAGTAQISSLLSACVCCSCCSHTLGPHLLVLFSHLLVLFSHPWAPPGLRKVCMWVPGCLRKVCMRVCVKYV